MIDKNDIMACLKDLLEDKADFALLFGSWAGEGLGMTAESDVDCGVFFCPQVAADKSWWELPDRFEMRTGLKLDLVCLNTADIIIASQIVVSGEPVFVHSQETSCGLAGAGDESLHRF